MHDKNRFLADIEEILNQALGHPKGTLVLKDVCERYAGETCYIPSHTEIFIKWRNQEIRKRFRGDNYKELANEFKLVIRQVRRIINDQ